MKNILEDKKIVAVVRAKTKQKAKDIVKAIIDGGIKCIELTYSIPDVVTLIPEIKKMYPDAFVGIGSVINEKMAKDAINAGATYVVSPGYVQEVSDICKKENTLYTPGCMTITEMLFAMKNGNDLVKLFPGDLFGAKFIKSVKAPVPQINIMPTGGVDINNIKEWLEAGVLCVGVGSCLTSFEKMEDITNMSKLFMEKIYEYKKSI